MMWKSTRTSRRSKREQIAQKARIAAEPIPEPPAPPASPISAWLLDPTPGNWERLNTAAGLGRLTKADLLAALTAEVKNVSEAMLLPDFDVLRGGYVLRGRLLRNMLEVVKGSVASGPVMMTRIVWPEHYLARDPGEDVRLEDPRDTPEGRAVH